MSNSLLDVKTLAIVLGFNICISAIILTLTSVGYKELKSTKYWAAGETLIALGFILFFLRGAIPPYISISIANGVFLLGNLFILNGMKTFFGKPWTWGGGLIFVACVWMPFNFTYDCLECLDLRIILSDFGHTTFDVWIISLCWKEWLQHKGQIKLLVIASFMIHGAISMSRSGWIILSGQFSSGAMPFGYSSKLFFIGHNVSVIILTLSFILLMAERFHNNLQKALEKEQKLLKEQNSFWAMVSHEFRGPLATIMASAELMQLKAGTQNPLVANESKRLENITSRLSRLIDQSMVHTWLDDRLAPAVFAPFDLNEAVREIAFEYKVKIEVEANGPVICNGNRNLFSLCVSSLVDNALKYGENKEAVAIRLTMPSEKQAVIDIQDDGPGVLPNEKDAIFEKYYRSSRFEQKGGSGLGLYSVKKIVDLHNAQIDIIDGPENIFRITLPLDDTCLQSASA